MWASAISFISVSTIAVISSAEKCSSLTMIIGLSPAPATSPRP
jgi:hypothetical protein